MDDDKGKKKRGDTRRHEARRRGREGGQVKKEENHQFIEIHIVKLSIYITAHHKETQETHTHLATGATMPTDKQTPMFCSPRHVHPSTHYSFQHTERP